MEKLCFDPRHDAFIKMAQQLAGLTIRHDLQREVGECLHSFFCADAVAFGERRDDGEINVHHWTIFDRDEEGLDLSYPRAVHCSDPGQFDVGTECLDAIIEVLEDGVATSRFISTPDPLAIALLPVIEDSQTTLLLVAHRTSEPLPDEQLSVYAAVSGLIGVTATRLASERDLWRDHHGLEQLTTGPAAESSALHVQLEQPVSSPVWDNEKLSHLTRVLRSLGNVGQLIAGEKDRDRLLQGVCDSLVETRAYSGVCIALLDEAVELLAFFEAYQSPNSSSPLLRLKDGVLPAFAQMAMTQSEIVVTESSTHDCVDATPAVKAVARAAMTVRLEHDDRVYGLLCVSIPDQYAGDEPEHLLLREISGDVASALYENELTEVRRRTANALDKSLVSLRQAETLAQLGYFERNWQTGDGYWSDGFYRLLGLMPGEIASDHGAFLAYVHPDDLSRVADHITATIAAHRPMSIEFSLVQSAGAIIFVQGIGETVYDDSGKALLTRGIFQDITERRKVAEALQQSERILNIAGKLGKVGGWEHDLATGQAVWTQALYDIVELPYDQEPPGVDEHLSFYPSPYGQMLEQAYQRAVNDGIPFDLELQGATAKQRSIWCRVLGEPVYENGKCTKMRGVLSDITESRTVTAALRESAAKYRTLFENMAQGAFYQRSDGVLIDCNPAALEMFGLTRDQFLGRTSMDPDWRVVDEDGSDLPGERHPSAMALRTGKPVRDVIAGVFNPRRQDYVWLSISAIPQFRAGEDVPYQTFVTLHDITERRAAENALRDSEQALVEAQTLAAIGSWEYDVAQNSATWSREMFRIFGRDPALGSLTWLEHRQYILPEDWACIDQVVHTASMMGISYHEEFRILHPDGSIVWAETVGQAQRSESGQVSKLSGTVQDITARKLVEEALRESEGKFRSLFENINAGVALHEIITDEHGTPVDFTFLDVNSTYEALTHLRAADIVGRRGTEVIPNLEQKWIDTYGRVAQTGEAVTLTDHSNYLDRYWEVKAYSPKRGQFAVTLTDVTDRRLAEEALKKRLVTLTKPLEDAVGLKFDDLFNLEDIQRLQDEFSQATGVASVITRPDGTPLTRPSGFCRLCSEVIRATDLGRANCFKSDAYLGQANPKGKGPTVEPCLSAGLWDAGAAITVGGKHIASWLIGQVRDETQTEEMIRTYAREIGADEADAVEAFYEVRSMPRERFSRIAQVLSTLASQLSTAAYQNVLQARSIVARERAEMALRESEERLRLSLAGSGVSLWEWFPESGVIRFDDRWARILGYEPGERVLDFHWWEQSIHPDSVEVFADALDAYLTGRNPRYELEYRIEANSGEWRWVWAAGECVEWDENRQPVRFLGTHRDITANKQAEEDRERLTAQVHEQAQQMQQVLATVPAGVVLLDGELRVLQANPVAVRDLTVLAGAGVGDTLTTLGDRLLVELLTSPPTPGLWHEIKFGDRTLEALARPVERGVQPEHWVLVLNDVTREREIRAQLQQQEQLAAVGQLAAGIAHDFNNILATIVIYAQMSLQSSDIPDQSRERMTVINQQAWHAKRLVEQILDFGRRAVLERRPLDLVLLLREQVKLLERTLPEHISIEFVHKADDCTVDADPTRLQQMLTNLAVNARDAMPEGGVLRIEVRRITIDAGRQVLPLKMEAGEWIRLTVSDTGTGMTPEVLSHVYEPFFTTKGPGAGSGLGLAQVHGIVGQHGGRIGVESQVGIGTTFVIYFPALSMICTEQDLSESKAVSLGHGETILVVEDNALLREAMVDVVGELHYRVLAAANGREALALLADHAEIALVLSDLVMPEMGGRVLFREMRARALNVPVVMLSGHPMSTEMQSLKDDGLAGWMIKPPDMAELSRLLARALGDEFRTKPGSLLQ